MTTIVKSVKSPNRTMTIEPSGYSDGALNIRIGGNVGIHADAADIIKVVEAECDVRLVPADAVVILRGELPEVEVGETGVVVAQAPDGVRLWFETLNQPRSSGPNNPNGRPEWHRERAFAHLALAEYLDSPPVDEAQVDALTAALCDADMDGVDGPVPSLVARRLYLAGVRIEPTEKEN